MAARKRDVTDAELAVLQLLWERGQATIRALADALYPGGSTSEYATVQKLLERLEQKHCVGRDRSLVPHVFRPLARRDDLIDLRLKALADKLCEGSVTPLLTQLVRGRRLSAGERKALRALVDELDGGRRRDGGRQP